MKRILVAGMVLLFVVVGLVDAQERIASVEAKALLNKAVAFYKANGQEKAFAAFNDRKGPFVDQELYIFVLDMNGKILAHGVKPELIGKDMNEIRDVYEKNFLKEMVVKAKTKGAGVVHHNWENPRTLSVVHESSYVETVKGVVLGCGYYE
jgi:signal transduction histidine kinase